MKKDPAQLNNIVKDASPEFLEGKTQPPRRFDVVFWELLQKELK